MMGPKDLNCVYDRKYTLRDIAEIINHLGDHKVDIESEGQYSMYSYIGKSNNLPIKYDGLVQGIKKVYEKYLC